jgi:hypothetical protein
MTTRSRILQGLRRLWDLLAKLRGNVPPPDIEFLQLRDGRKIAVLPRGWRFTPLRRDNPCECPERAERVRQGVG